MIPMAQWRNIILEGLGNDNYYLSIKATHNLNSLTVFSLWPHNLYSPDCPPRVDVRQPTVGGSNPQSPGQTDEKGLYGTTWGSKLFLISYKLSKHTTCHVRGMKMYTIKGV